MAMLRSIVLLMVFVCTISKGISFTFSTDMHNVLIRSVRMRLMRIPNFKTDSKWKEYTTTFKKHFEVEKVAKKRYAAFLQTYTNIVEHNDLYERGESLFKLGLNAYSDLTATEYKTYLLGLEVPKNPVCKGVCKLDRSFQVASRRRFTRSVPASIDWRDHGLVTHVKDQGRCAACWAFATAGVLEGQIAKKTGHLQVLSEQNLIDCSKPFHNRGCRGGWMYYAYNYVLHNKGIDKPYTYEARSSRCRFSRAKVAGTCRGYRAVARSEAALKWAVGTIGPIAVAIDSSKQSFRSYTDGVYNDPRCSKRRPNHAVLVVGYGTHNGTKYWLIKNSWGTSWGLCGYMMLARKANNMCGIANYGSYPIV